MDKKLSFSVRIDDVSPSHVRVSIFNNMVLQEYDHEEVTRAFCGKLVFSVEEFKPWLEHVQPHLVTFKDLHVENDLVDVHATL